VLDITAVNMQKRQGGGGGEVGLLAVLSLPF
jgi:hypothetical protein